MEDENHFLRLDEAVCSAILQHLLLSDGGRSALKLGQTCRQWKHIATDEYWWGSRCVERYHQIVQTPGGGFAGIPSYVTAWLGQSRQNHFWSKFYLGFHESSQKKGELSSQLQKPLDPTVFGCRL